MLTASDYVEPINIGSSELVSINQLADIVESIAGIKLKRHYKLDAPKGVNGRNSDNTLIRQVLGWEPGTRLRDGLGRQARTHGLGIVQSGPVQLPFLTFAADTAAGTFDRANVFTGEAARLGVWLHPWHNWFLSAAHTDDDVDLALDRTEAAFAAVRARFGSDAASGSVA